MGGGIAMSLANIGIPTTIVERDDASLARGLDRVTATYGASVKRGKLEQSVMDQRLALIEGTTDFGAISGADVIIEAAFEEMDVKRDVFRALDKHAKPEAVLASNTSALDIDVIAAATNRPDAVVGAHFFSPANVMRLLEVVRGAQTRPQVLADMMQLGRSMGKTAVLAGNAPDFIGNAMLFEYHREAMFLIEDGALPAQVDRVLREFG
jgi:3-hydroxyacyl-CoA dehydrogenase